MEFTEERMNFVKLSYILLDVVAKHLRELFIKKWNEKYPNNQWTSDATSGDFLYNELPFIKAAKDAEDAKIAKAAKAVKDGNKKEKEVKKKGNPYHDKMKTGKEEEWDITTLVKVMLDSGLNLVPGCRGMNERNPPLLVSEEIDIIRQSRNTSFGHETSMSCSPNKFATVVTEIKSVAKSLFGDDVEKEICEIENGSIDKTMIEKLVELFKMETDLKKHVDEMDNKLNGKLS